MQKLLFLSIAAWTTFSLYQLPLDAQTSLPYSTSSVQGSTIITNYYDPNAGPNVGPGLSPTPLQSRFDGPLNTFANTPGVPTTAVVPVTQPQPFLAQPFVPHAPTGPVILNPIPSISGPHLPSHYEDPTYPYPGLLTLMNGKWIGSSYLYNIPRDIGIVIEVIMPGNRQIAVNTNELRKQASELFMQANIHPESLAIGDDPPLPFFHVLIFVYPDEERYTAAITGRLFEKVRLARLDFNLPGTFQAITWEKLDLIITSPVQFNDQLSEAVREIVKAFLNRVKFFDEEKLKQESGFRLQANTPRKVRPRNTLLMPDGCRPCPCPCR